MTVWGPIVGAPALRRAIRTTLQLWLPGAVAEAARQNGDDPTTIPAVRSWRVVSLAQAQEDQLPAVFVTSPGMVGAPRRHGSGLYEATWNATVTVAARDQSHEATADLIGIYTAAVRTVCMQRPSFGGFAASTAWAGEEYDAIEAKAGRTLAAGFVDLTVVVLDVLNAFGGPATPPVDPLALPGNWPLVATHNETVVNVLTDQEMP